MAIVDTLNKRLLKQIDVFSGLAEEDLDSLTKAAVEKIYEPMDFIFKQNDKADCFYVIKAGIVRIVRGATNLAELNAGEIFGEMGVLDDKPRGASAQAATNLVLLAVTKDALLSVIGERRSVEMKIRRKILERHTANIATTFHRT